MTSSQAEPPRVLIGVSGGIAAYKSAELCRQLIKHGSEVQVIMTDAATRFVAPLTFEALTGRPVYSEMFERAHAWEMEHISLARWGQVLAIVPATANTLAKMAAGLADDPLSTTVLAFRGPVVVAPAMNTAMWEHSQTQANVAKLRGRGVTIVEPGAGELACGEVGAGRLAELDAVREAIEGTLGAAAPASGPLAGRKVLVTAGPTVEYIDPVRFLSNPSLGRMGFALAAEARRLGAEVTLVRGPTHVPHPGGLACVEAVTSASEMHAAVMRQLADQDVCVFSAAVADYTPAAPSARKIKKEQGSRTLTLELARTPDIAAEAGAARRPDQTLVGFAAETDHLEENARAKMDAKGFDVIVANEVSADNPAFAAAENQVTLLARSGERRELPRGSKDELAGPIWEFILQHGRSCGPER